ncbi:MAG: PPK2 family polyphosphate kinase [Bacteroidota bacterium]
MIKLSDYPTDAPKGLDKDEIKDKTKDLADEIADLHEVMVAEKKHSLLVIFQGMDSSGKDGSSKNVFGECGPIGISVSSFKKPTELEFAHDFLWRIHKEVPQKGEIKIFNRSHYEDILIQRVHGWIDEERAEARIEAINAFEKLLVTDNKTTILKFYLHLSQERQREKLQERLDEPKKNWKHNDNDWEEAKLWDQYRWAYEEAINRCNVVPWHIVPVDQRWYRNYHIAKIVLETMQKMNMRYPVLETQTT